MRLSIWLSFLGFLFPSLVLAFQCKRWQAIERSSPAPSSPIFSLQILPSAEYDALAAKEYNEISSSLEKEDAFVRRFPSSSLSASILKKRVRSLLSLFTIEDARAYESPATSAKERGILLTKLHRAIDAIYALIQAHPHSLLSNSLASHAFALHSLPQKALLSDCYFRRYPGYPPAEKALQNAQAQYFRDAKGRTTKRAHGFRAFLRSYPFAPQAEDARKLFLQADFTEESSLFNKATASMTEEQKDRWKERRVNSLITSRWEGLSLWPSGASFLSLVEHESLIQIFVRLYGDTNNAANFVVQNKLRQLLLGIKNAIKSQDLPNQLKKAFQQQAELQQRAINQLGHLVLNQTRTLQAGFRMIEQTNAEGFQLLMKTTSQSIQSLIDTTGFGFVHLGKAIYTTSNSQIQILQKLAETRPPSAE